jgi:hypothetical protein
MFRHYDAEQLFIDYLGPLLAVPVGTKAPGGPPPAFVRIVRTGGPRTLPVSDRPHLTFDAYARLGSVAWELADKARMAVYAVAGTVVGGVSVKDVVEIGGPANLPDPLFPDYSRYSFTLAVHLRGRQDP